MSSVSQGPGMQLKTVQNLKHFMKNIKEKNLFKEILQNEKRSLKDCEYILEQIIRIKFFENFISSTFSGNHTSVLIDFSRKLRFETANMGDIVMLQGEESNDKMYVILSGAVNVYKQELGMNLYSQPELLKRKSKLYDQHYQEKYGLYLRTMIKEEGFGEKALMEEGVSSKRTATIVAKTDCEFIIINKSDFLKVKENYVKILEDKKNQILIGFPVLKTNVVSSVILENFLFFFESITIHKGEYLSREGSPSSEKLYLITEGEFLVEKEVKPDDVKQVLFMIEGFPRDKTIEQFSCKPAKLSHLGKGSLIGEECILDKERGVDIYTISCTSPEGRLYSLSKEAILKKFPKFFLSFIKKKYKQRLLQRNEALRKYIFKLLKTHELLSLMKIVPNRHDNLNRLLSDPNSFMAEKILEKRTSRNEVEFKEMLNEVPSPKYSKVGPILSEPNEEKEQSPPRESSPLNPVFLKTKNLIEEKKKMSIDTERLPRTMGNFHTDRDGVDNSLELRDNKVQTNTSRWSPKARKKEECIRKGSVVSRNFLDFERVGDLKDFCRRKKKNDKAVLQARSKHLPEVSQDVPAENAPNFLDSKVFDFNGIQGLRQQKYFKSKLFEYGLVKSPLDKSNPIPKVVKKKSDKFRKTQLLNKLNYKPSALTETSLESLDTNLLGSFLTPMEHPNNLLNSYTLTIYSDQEFEKSAAPSNLSTYRSMQRIKMLSTNHGSAQQDSTLYSAYHLNDMKLPPKFKRRKPPAELPPKENS